MLATGILILKIIGLILLGILGLILALFLVVLLAPIRYRAEVSYYGEAKAKVSVSWLLHIISCKAIYDGELDVGIRVFGFPVGGKAEAESAGEARHGSEAVRDMREPDAEKEALDEQKDLEDEILEELEAERREEEHKEREHIERNHGKKRMHGKKQLHRKKQLTRFGIPFSFQEICDRRKQAGEQKDKIAEFLKKEENQKTFRLLKRQIKALLKHILPARMKGKVKFGFDDPYTTGQVLMYISPFYGIYGRRFQIVPVFEETVLEGEAWLKGRIRIGTVLAVCIRMLLDKNFRTLLKKWRK